MQRRYAQLSLKPQDVLILVKLCGYESNNRPPYAQIARDIDMSTSEINAAVKRLQHSQLIHPSREFGEPVPRNSELPILDAVEEFLIHGVKYAFPATKGMLVRGMPTSYAAEPLSRLLVPGEGPIPVWPDKHGEVRGIALSPLYKSVPEAARRDSLLYARLALIDAIRDGSARHRSIAKSELIASLRGKRSV
jgi:hypothetical protein